MQNQQYENLLEFVLNYDWSKWDFMIGILFISAAICSIVMLSVLAFKSWTRPQYKAEKVTWINRVTQEK